MKNRSTDQNKQISKFLKNLVKEKIISFYSTWNLKVRLKMSDFGELLQAAEQLTAEFDPSSSSDLPRVERNLHQIVEAGQQLFAKTSRDVGSQDVKAAILLGSRGIDLPSITNKLESISTGFATATEPTEPLRDTDVIGFLRYLLKMLLLL